jgi:hypothetical protein
MNTVILASACKPWPASGPVTFQPGTCYSFAPHAAPWHITMAGLGWIIAAWLLAGLVLNGTIDWLFDRYEVTRSGRRVRVTRRWYGNHAHVCLRCDADDDEADRFLVREWAIGDTEVPWLLVLNLDDEDAGAFWAPVTGFAPYTVRRLRPHFERFGRLPVLWLTRYLPLRQPAGHLGTDA